MSYVQTIVMIDLASSLSVPIYFTRENSIYTVDINNKKLTTGRMKYKYEYRVSLHIRSERLQHYRQIQKHRSR